MRYHFYVPIRSSTDKEKLKQDTGRPTGWDRVRRAEVGDKDYALDTFEEVYTTKHWMVRIFKVKDDNNLGNQEDHWIRELYYYLELSYYCQ